MDEAFAGQGRGNSGVYLQVGHYELQILDSYQHETYVNGQAGSIYKQTAPLVNAMLPPGQWNVYDIIYNAPIFNEDGTFTSKIAGTPFSGKYTFDEATQKITLKGLLLTMNCYAKKEAKGISILFEAKKLLTVLQTMSAMSGSKDLQTLGDLSKNYDGVRVGFDMIR
jgi:hypothetical protein